MTIISDTLFASGPFPVDAKSSFDDILSRDNLPLSARYKGLLCSIKGATGVGVKFYVLNTDNLTNTGWTEVDFGAGNISITIDDWNPLTSYIAKQPVVYDGILYRARITFISSTIFSDDSINWEKIGGDSGVTKIPNFQTNNFYEQYQPILYDGNLYRANIDFTSGLAFVSTDWELLVSATRLSYVHNQLTASDMWEVEHNLGTKFVNTVITDELGNEVITLKDWADSTDNLLIIRSNDPFIGRVNIWY